MTLGDVLQINSHRVHRKRGPTVDSDPDARHSSHAVDDGMTVVRSLTTQSPGPSLQGYPFDLSFAAA